MDLCDVIALRFCTLYLSLPAYTLAADSVLASRVHLLRQNTGWQPTLPTLYLNLFISILFDDFQRLPLWTAIVADFVNFCCEMSTLSDVLASRGAIPFLRAIFCVSQATCTRVLFMSGDFNSFRNFESISGIHFYSCPAIISAVHSVLCHIWLPR